MKQCTRCSQLKELTLFGANKHHTDGLQSYCKECGNKARRGKYQDKYKQRHVRVKYGLTVSEYDNILSRGCQVCGSTTSLCLDHDHYTGKVRGCLCSNCNTALGLLKDNLERIKNLAKYLEEANV